MSLGVRHSMLFVAAIHVASLGADQFSFGVTLPPSSSMVSLIFWWTSRNWIEGSRRASSSSESSSAENIPLSVSVRLACWSESLSGGRTMPSSRR